MSRGYGDGGDGSIGYLWDSIVERAAQGKRGQAFLRDLITELYAMRERGEGLIHTVVSCDGMVCTLGAGLRARGKPEVYAVERPTECRKESSDPLIQHWICECIKCMPTWEDVAGEQDENPDCLARDLAKHLNIAWALARDIMAINDECDVKTPQERLAYMIDWVERQIVEWDALVPA